MKAEQYEIAYRKMIGRVVDLINGARKRIGDEAYARNNLRLAEAEIDSYKFNMRGLGSDKREIKIQTKGIETQLLGTTSRLNGVVEERTA